MSSQYYFNGPLLLDDRKLNDLSEDAGTRLESWGERGFSATFMVTSFPTLVLDIYQHAMVPSTDNIKRLTSYTACFPDIVMNSIKELDVLSSTPLTQDGKSEAASLDDIKADIDIMKRASPKSVDMVTKQVIATVQQKMQEQSQAAFHRREITLAEWQRWHQILSSIPSAEATFQGQVADWEKAQRQWDEMIEDLVCETSQINFWLAAELAGLQFKPYVPPSESEKSR